MWRHKEFQRQEKGWTLRMWVGVVVVLHVFWMGVTCCPLVSEVTMQQSPWYESALSQLPTWLYSGHPNPEYTFSQKKRCATNVAIQRQHVGPVDLRCHCVCVTVFVYIDPLIYVCMYLCAHLCPYCSTFWPVGACRLTGKHCFGKSVVWYRWARKFFLLILLSLISYF